MEKKINKLERQQLKTNKRTEEIINLIKDLTQINKVNIHLWEENFRIWKKFLKSFMWIIALLVIMINTELIIKIGAWIWFSLSENWRILAAGSIWSLLLVFLSVFLTIKFINKKTDSASSENRKNSEIDKD
jgi:uncharacterized membrane protein